MRFAVYTIALNEEATAAAFMANTKDADYVVVGDTGSTDKTAQIIQAGGGSVFPIRVHPWRFDIARNTVLSVLPADIDFCISLDLDERLSPGWRDLLERQLQDTDYTRVSFRYVHFIKADGTHGAVGTKDFIHARDGYVWQHMVHEKLYRAPAATPEKPLFIPELVIEHRQEHGKNRNYLPLLELECRQPGTSNQHIFWLLRDYLFAENWEQVLIWGPKFLACDGTWHVERANAMRYMAKAYAHVNDPTTALAFHLKSIAEAPGEREVWLDLTWYYLSRNEWVLAYAAITKCLSIQSRPTHYLTTEDAWGDKPAITLKSLEHRLRSNSRT